MSAEKPRKYYVKRNPKKDLKSLNALYISDKLQRCQSNKFLNISKFRSWEAHMPFNAHNLTRLSDLGSTQSKPRQPQKVRATLTKSDKRRTMGNK